MQGYFGGKVDLIFQRLLEIWNSIPELFVLLILSSLFVPGFWTLLGILMIFSWTSLVGLVRAEFLRGRNLEYVRAARALGLSDWQIIFKHLLPNATVATLTFLPFKLSGGIAALDRPRLPWARHAAGIAVARRTSARRQKASRSAVARHFGFHCRVDHPVARDLHG